MKKSLLLILLIGLVISSCAKSEIKRDEIIFASNIIKYNSTLKVLDNEWSAADSIGIYMFANEEQTIVENAENIPYITTKGGKTGAFVPKGRVIYFPHGGDQVRFMAYYPYNPNVVGGMYKINVSDQSNQSAIDLLYSFDPNALYSKEFRNEKVLLKFDHMLSKVIINVKKGQGFENKDIEKIEIALIGMNRTADFKLSGTEFQNYTNKGDIIPQKTAVNKGYVVSYEAIILPTLDVLCAQIVFDLKNKSKEDGMDSDVFKWNLETTLARSTKYTYNVTINRSDIEVETIAENWSQSEEIESN